MTEYNFAMTKWMYGTGGGSGFPEDFGGRWEEREELELFAHYAQSGTCDYLAYILMYDKSVGFTLNAVNDPAPKNTVMENGMPSAKDGKQVTGGKRRRGEKLLLEQTKRVTEMMGQAMKDVVQPLIEVVRLQANGNGMDSNSGSMGSATQGGGYDNTTAVGGDAAAV